MNVIEILEDDHRRILALLALLDITLDRLAAGRAPPRQVFDVGTSLANEYADGFHHFKEEYLLFGVLAQKHHGELDRMILRHREQHEQTRDLLKDLSAALDGYARGEPEAIATVGSLAAFYVRTLRGHIRSENEVFFPMAHAALTDTEKDVLLDQFTKYEQSTAPGARERMDAGLDEMRQLLR